MRSATSSQPIRLSACLIVKDEESRLPECLASVAFCDEVIVVDSGSSDRTAEIARAAGATVLERPWKGFGAQRNMALDAARGEWALEVDADERITPHLREEIIALVTEPPPAVDNAVISLRQVFLGVPLGASANYPASRTRLFRRDRYRHDDRRAVHEGLWPAGQSAYPTGDLEHLLATSLRESVRDTRSYSWLESTQLPEGVGVRALVVGIVMRPAAKFVYRTWLLGGWQDGFAGITKIVLDCAYDSLTWARYLRAGRRPGDQQRRIDTGIAYRSGLATEAGDTGHFGRSTGGYSGPVRIAAVARGATRALAAREWLAGAADAGADVVLITDAPPSSSRLRTIEIGGAGPLAVLRAISAEDQRNPIEVLVLPGRCGRAASRLLPGHLRGRVGPVSLGTNPRELISTVFGLRPEAASAGPERDESHILQNSTSLERPNQAT